MTFKVRVGCITYNHAPYIKDTLEGFCIQETDFPFLCTVFDDASTDGEQKVINQYLEDHFDLGNTSIASKVETDDYIQIFAQHKINKNCYFAVLFLKYNHYSLNKPKLQYIPNWQDSVKYTALCEGDDYWTDPLKLQKQVSFLESHDDFVMCFTDCLIFDENKGTKYRRSIFNKGNRALATKGKDCFYDIILGYCEIRTLSVLIRTEAYFNRMVTPVAFMMGDVPLWLDLSQQGNIMFMEDCTGVYRKHIGSASRNPDTLKKFQFSMYEMRIYYCIKYGYDIPQIIKRKYNRALAVLRMNNIYIGRKPLYDIFSMNSIQNGIYNRIEKRHCSIFLVIFLFKFEILIEKTQKAIKVLFYNFSSSK